MQQQQVKTRVSRKEMTKEGNREQTAQSHEETRESWKEEEEKQQHLQEWWHKKQEALSDRAGWVF